MGGDVGPVPVPPEQAPANYVPAAAVRRRGRALSGMTGRKGRVGGAVRGVGKPPAHPGEAAANGRAGGQERGAEFPVER